MITILRDRSRQINLLTPLIAAAVLALAFLLGQRASPLWLGLLVVGICGVVLLARPVLGLPALVFAALVVRLEFGTGTYVSLNPASLLVPVLLVLWLLDMVRQRYAYLASIRPNFSAELNEARRKMAQFPRGAAPLANPNGAAPGLALDINEHTTIVSLPGVPSEMKDIFATSMQPILARTIGAGGHVERTIVLDRGDESRIAALLQLVQSAHPSVYVKSRGQMVEDGLHLTVVLSRGGSDLRAIRGEVDQTERDVVAGLMELGYAVLRVIGD